MVGQVDDGGLVGGRRIIDFQFIRIRQRINHPHVQIPGEPLFPVLAQISQLKRLAVFGGNFFCRPNGFVEALGSAVKRVFAIIFRKRVRLAVQRELRVPDAVSIAADERAEITLVVHVAVQRNAAPALIYCPTRCFACSMISVITSRYFSNVSSTTVIVGICSLPRLSVFGLKCPKPDSCTPLLPRPGAGWLRCSNARTYFFMAGGYPPPEKTWNSGMKLINASYGISPQTSTPGNLLRKPSTSSRVPSCMSALVLFSQPPAMSRKYASAW